MTDQGRLARACRLMVKIELFDRVKGWFTQEAILDTGAPFSVFPFTVWNGNNLSWTPLGSHLLTLQGQADPEALKWLGISCELGVVPITLLDETNQRTRPMRAIAKFPLSAPPGRFKQDIILGYHFLMDNPLTLTVNPASRATVGNLANVVGFLMIR